MLKRRRHKQTMSFKDCLADWAEKTREQAALLPPGTTSETTRAFPSMKRVLSYRTFKRPRKRLPYPWRMPPEMAPADLMAPSIR